MVKCQRKVLLCACIRSIQSRITSLNMLKIYLSQSLRSIPSGFRRKKTKSKWWLCRLNLTLLRKILMKQIKSKIPIYTLRLSENKLLNILAHSNSIIKQPKEKSSKITSKRWKMTYNNQFKSSKIKTIVYSWKNKNIKSLRVLKRMLMMKSKSKRNSKNLWVFRWKPKKLHNSFKLRMKIKHSW